jgi:hypothetical protein
MGRIPALSLTIVLGLTACRIAGTHSEDAHRSTHTLRQEPHRAAVCIARNVDRRDGLDARIRQGREPVLVEVHVSAGVPVALAQLVIAGDGSTAIIATASDLRESREELVSAMIGGC